MPMRHLAFLAALGIAAPALAAGPRGEDRLAGLLQGRTAGAPQHCLTLLRPQDRTTTIEGVGILYEVGATRYLMRFAGGCPQLTAFTFPVTQTPTDQLCEGDIARIVERSTPGITQGSCVFGPFTPYPKAR